MFPLKLFLSIFFLFPTDAFFRKQFYSQSGTESKWNEFTTSVWLRVLFGWVLVLVCSTCTKLVTDSKDLVIKFKLHFIVLGLNKTLDLLHCTCGMLIKQRPTNYHRKVSLYLGLVHSVCWQNMHLANCLNTESFVSLKIPCFYVRWVWYR